MLHLRAIYRPRRFLTRTPDHLPMCELIQVELCRSGQALPRRQLDNQRVHAFLVPGFHGTRDVLESIGTRSPQRLPRAAEQQSALNIFIGFQDRENEHEAFKGWHPHNRRYFRLEFGLILPASLIVSAGGGNEIAVGKALRVDGNAVAAESAAGIGAGVGIVARRVVEGRRAACRGATGVAKVSGAIGRANARGSRGARC